MVLLAALLCPATAHAQNAIVTENQRPGAPASQWDVAGAGDASIQGFATDISYNRGEIARFKIKTNANAYAVSIYRLGYYQGNGARQVGAATVTATLPQSQPAYLFDSVTGLVDCGNWAESAHWNIPADAVSGIYIARLLRGDTQGASHITFIVRDDSSHADLQFQTSDATWTAYNSYGGNTLYLGTTSYPGGHATKVSYNRPMLLRAGGGGTAFVGDGLFNAEYPMVRWLEANGYDVSYSTNVDADRRGALILRHKVFVSVGHDEYWSAAQLANVTAARDAGVHLAFFSGNEVYWKTRWEPSSDASATAYRTLVCYKEGTLGENSCGGKCDPLAGSWTGLWRDGCSASPPADGCKPENALTGQLSWYASNGAIHVPDNYGRLRFWRNTSIASLTSGQNAVLSPNTLGYEWDWQQASTSYPAGRILLSETLLNNRKHYLSLYRHSNGALVFGAGTVQWSWGLDGVHERGGSTPSTEMRQATVNLLADMHALPGSLQPGLVAATASTDITAPTSSITRPAQNAQLARGVSITLTGTAADAGGVVAGIEISFDGGTTWHRAAGTTNWFFNWTPTELGGALLLSRGFDDSGNMQSSGNQALAEGVAVTVVEAQSAACPCSIFPPDAPPVGALLNDSVAIELGMRFRPMVNGTVMGARFWSGSGNTGTHTGHLWSAAGASLATATFPADTAAGWREVMFPSPVAVTAGTTYVVSYHSSDGWYSESDPFFISAFASGPLRALADTEDGSNGLFVYSATPKFPNLTFESSNYWVDVVFSTGVLDVPRTPAGSGGFALLGSTPNPFNGSTTVMFELPSGEHVDVDVFDLSGRRVRALVAEPHGPGRHSVLWNRRDDRGQPVAAGVYIYRLRAGPFRATRRMVLLP